MASESSIEAWLWEYQKVLSELEIPWDLQEGLRAAWADGFVAAFVAAGAPDRFVRAVSEKLRLKELEIMEGVKGRGPKT